MNGTFQYTTRRKEGRDKFELDNGWFTGRSDFGYAYFVNGDRFVGGWSNGKMEGEGTYFYRAGDKYEGAFGNGLKTGTGSFTFGDLREYKGEFTADKLEGQGRMTFPEGHVYEGSFADWKRFGDGTMTRRNGDVYVGVWDDESGVGRVSVTSADFNMTKKQLVVRLNHYQLPIQQGFLRHRWPFLLFLLRYHFGGKEMKSQSIFLSQAFSICTVTSEDF